MIQSAEATNITPVSLDELNGILDRVKEEKWDELVIVGSLGHKYVAEIREATSPDIPVFKVLRTDVDVPTTVGQLTDLVALRLVGLQIDAAGATALAQLKNLTTLNLDRNEIGDAGAMALAQLKNLTTLNLDRNEIGDAGATALAQLKNLTTLDLEGNNIGAEGATVVR